MSDFKLSAQLKGHDADVRAVLFPAADVVLSASRDRTVRIWRRTKTTPIEFDASITTQGHDYINALSFLRPFSGYKDGLIVSGGKDTIIEVRKPTSTPDENAERLLIGHAHNICALDVSPKSTWIVSGSWDGHARVWNVGKWEAELVLKHNNGGSVWTVLALDENTVVTGCADSKIRIFDLRRNNAGEVEPRATISTPEVVRALAKLPTGIRGHPSGGEIASASNDGVIRLWKLNGQQVGELHGHESYIYSLGTLPSGEIVSSGEDRTVRIWRGKECIQTITHPAISVWSVAVCAETGDIVSGASDNVVRIFTRVQDRVADTETLAQFEESVKASAIPQQQLGNTINKESLDRPDWLQTHAGAHDGQVKTIREDDESIGAYQWSMSQQKWDKVGTVVDSAGSSGRKAQYQGKEYDFVFDVDIEDGKPPLKLPYNLSENPYERATKFLGDNELPLSYLDSVANFITENTKGATIGQQSQATGPDPLGTDSRYRPDQPQTTKKNLPHEEFVTMTQIKFDPIQRKLLKLNEGLIESGNKHLALNPDDTKALADLIQTLSSGKTSNLPPAGVNIVLKVITEWPYSDRLAGLDLFRILVTSPTVASLEKPANVIQLVLRSTLETDGAVNENMVMMALRAIANIFTSDAGRAVAASQADNVVSALERISGVDGNPVGAQNVNLQIALATAAFNYACLGYKSAKSANGAVGADVLTLLCNVIAQVLRTQGDAEVLYRALMAVGTVLAIPGTDDYKKAVKDLGVDDAIREALQKAPEARVKDVAQECLAFLR
ncbi:PFU-domain-containing protein [Thozetella sp. PMI_491]|nr:PFU-domain-containing protein [Thozetella sp. PMI_491]